MQRILILVSSSLVLLIHIVSSNVIQGTIVQSNATKDNILNGIDKTKEGLSKRHAFASETNEKSLDDPPPEYYRGSGTKISSERFNSNQVSDGTLSISSSPLVVFPDNHSRNKNSNINANNGRLPNGQQRLSVGHHNYGVSGIDEVHSHRNNGYDEGRVSYGHQQLVNYNSGHNYGAYNNDYSQNSGGYYVASHPGDSYQEDKGYNVGGIEHSYGLSDGGHGDYGGLYHNEDKIHFAKSFLIPLAGAAVLGIAAALFTNPVLLQLGSVTSGLGVLGKKRRRRDISKKSDASDYGSQILAYGHHFDLKKSAN